MAQILPTLLTFALCVILLYWLQRWITQHVQGIGLLLFNNADYGMALLWLVLLPGILLHEGSHWITAKVLGLKTGKFSFTPNTVKGQIVLGSVEVQRSNAFKDSLVGLAPFLAGTLALLILGYAVFDVGALGRAWEDNAWQRMFNLLVGTLRVDDAFAGVARRRRGEHLDGGDLLAEHLDAAGSGLLSADEVTQQCAFAAAAAAHDDESVTGIHLEAHAIEHRLLAEMAHE